MSLSGIHLSLAYINDGEQNNLPRSPAWSQSQSSPGTVQFPARVPSAITNTALLSISASAPIFYSLGASPDASAGIRRYYDPATGRETIRLTAADTALAWVLA